MDGVVQRHHAKVGLLNVRNAPGGHFPGPPVHDRHEIKEAVPHGDVGDVGVPDLPLSPCPYPTTFPPTKVFACKGHSAGRATGLPMQLAWLVRPVQPVLPTPRWDVCAPGACRYRNTCQTTKLTAMLRRAALVDRMAHCEVLKMTSASAQGAPSAATQPKLAILGAAGTLQLLADLRRAGAHVLLGETAPDTASEGLAAQYGYRQLSARTGDVGCLRAFRQILDTATTGNPPANWIWQRADGRFVDGLRSRTDPDGVASREELVHLRQAHHAALKDAITAADEMVLLWSGGPCVVDAANGSAFAFAPDPGTILPKGVRLLPHEPDLASLEDDFSAIHRLISATNPHLRLRLVLLPLPVDPVAASGDFAARLPGLRRQSDLRLMMAEWQARYPNVSYLPLWDYCTGPLALSGDFMPQTATLTPAGREKAAGLCMGHAAWVATSVTPEPVIPAAESDFGTRKALRAQRRAGKARNGSKADDVICEEELLEAFSR
jgi:hypothetical protein